MLLHLEEETNQLFGVQHHEDEANDIEYTIYTYLLVYTLHLYTTFCDMLWFNFASGYNEANEDAKSS